MPSLNFKSQFAVAVATGRKTQTIRATRKHPINVGDALHLFTGMRTKQCQRLLVAFCTKVTPIIIHWDFHAYVRLGGKFLTKFEIYDLAVRDGFQDDAEFFRFFRDNHGKNFEGQLIEWRC